MQQFDSAPLWPRDGESKKQVAKDVKEVEQRREHGAQRS
jgi:hypothetical protein